jgi:hypothetical protein
VGAGVGGGGVGGGAGPHCPEAQVRHAQSFAYSQTAWALGQRVVIEMVFMQVPVAKHHVFTLADDCTHATQLVGHGVGGGVG